jgi:hypothetical protein
LLKPESSLFSVKFMGLRHGGNTEGGECFYDLIVDLQRLNASAGAMSSEPSIQPAAAPNPAEHTNVTMADGDSWKRNL